MYAHREGQIRMTHSEPATNDLNNDELRQRILNAVINIRKAVRNGLDTPCFSAGGSCELCPAHMKENNKVGCVFVQMHFDAEACFEALPILGHMDEEFPDAQDPCRDCPGNEGGCMEHPAECGRLG